MGVKAEPGDKRKGNQFWKARSKHGRDKIFKTPESLRKAAEGYFEWVDNNPLWEDKVTQYQGEPVSLPIAKMRAMTITGFCRFVHIDHDTWLLYSKREDFIGVTREIEGIIRDQKFAGAAAELLNANIIARDLGMVDKSQTEVSIKPVVKVVNLSGQDDSGDD